MGGACAPVGVELCYRSSPLDPRHNRIVGETPHPHVPTLVPPRPLGRRDRRHPARVRTHARVCAGGRGSSRPVAGAPARAGGDRGTRAPWRSSCAPRERSSCCASLLLHPPARPGAGLAQLLVQAPLAAQLLGPARESAPACGRVSAPPACRGQPAACSAELMSVRRGCSIAEDRPWLAVLPGRSRRERDSRLVECLPPPRLRAWEWSSSPPPRRRAGCGRCGVQPTPPPGPAAAPPCGKASRHKSTTDPPASRRRAPRRSPPRRQLPPDPAPRG